MLLQKIPIILVLLALSCQSQKIDHKEYVEETSHPAKDSFDQRVQYLIIHYTAVDEQRSFDLLTGANWPASAHYLISDHPPNYHHKPLVYHLVGNDKRAWHAGRSSWQGNTNLNAASLGVELVNFGYIDAPDPEDIDAIYKVMQDEQRMGANSSLTKEQLIELKSHWLYDQDRYWIPFEKEQIQALIALVKELVHQYEIEPDHVLGHIDIAPHRKHDPGPLFPWQEMYVEGIGAWYEQPTLEWYVGDRQPETFVDNTLLLKALAVYGYEVPTPLDKRIPLKMLTKQELALQAAHEKEVIRAFQMHFRPSNFSGIADVESEAIALALVERYRGIDQVEALLAKTAK
jgi:N-acetylmuramoyl-L-alanine amidase